MYLDVAIKINEFISNLQEPQRFLMYMLIYIGIPLLCMLLYKADKKMHENNWLFLKCK